MNVSCSYCGQFYPDTEPFCPHCGAPNEKLASDGRAVPRNIAELRQFCAAHHLPLEQMRFFIGENYTGPRAFGIFKDDRGVCTVYKNKADGSRAIRYQGTDEEYAVREIYEKMKSEIQNQRRRRSSIPVSSPRPPVRQKRNRFPVWFVILLAALVLWLVSGMGSGAPRGYYHYDNGYYYQQNGNWYRYDSNLGRWVLRSVVDAALEENAEDYYTSSDWSYDYGVTEFSGGSSGSSGYSSSQSGSSWYDSDWDSDWDDSWSDSDWDWDSGDSWDSDWSDWDSDW